jgi:CDP-diacylglycerol--glycerol-3-phosphate 3-phosphatidyltransferase
LQPKKVTNFRSEIHNPIPNNVTSNNSHRMLNVPNLITLARVALTLVLFVLLALNCYLASFILFVLAASTDWLDGYWARRHGQVTQLGRVLDPFADKLIISGTFIFLAAAPPLASGSLTGGPLTGGHSASGIAAWMAVVIVGRELLVTALRSFVEHSGGDFSAKWAGKWKMVFQCAAACFSMYRLTYFDPATGTWTDPPPAWMGYGLTITIWLAIVLTIYSGVGYLQSAWKVLREADE